jgi:hypothetical protein
MRSRKWHNLLPPGTLTLLRIHRVDQWCQWASMCGETRAQCVVGLFRTLWRNGHNFQQSTTSFWRADNGTLHGCCFRNFRRSSGPRQDQIKRTILDAWKFKNNYHWFEWTQPEVLQRTGFQVLLQGLIFRWGLAVLKVMRKQDCW